MQLTETEKRNEIKMYVSIYIYIYDVKEKKNTSL